jgi:hypothetical protein
MGKRKSKSARREDVIDDLSLDELHYILTVYSPPPGWEVRYEGLAIDSLEFPTPDVSDNLTRLDVIIERHRDLASNTGIDAATGRPYGTLKSR